MEDTVCVGGNSVKRNRDEAEEPPQAKRIRAADLILDILDDVDAPDRSAAAPADGDLASVMRSLEEEIASFSPPRERPQQTAGGLTGPPASGSPEERRDSDLGYLLEASDDELGLPPTVPSSSDEGEGADGDLAEDGNQGTIGSGQIWGLEDEIPNCYDALDFGVFGGDGRLAGDDDGAVFVGGLFDYADVASFGPSDYSDFSWQPESLSAL